MDRKLWTTDSLLGRLGLQRRTSLLGRVGPVLAGVGLGALAGVGLLTAARTEKETKLAGRLKKKLSRKKDVVVTDEAVPLTPAMPVAAKRDGVRASA